MNLRTLLVLLPLVAASCSNDGLDNDTQPSTRTISVTVGSGPRIDAEIESRTALDPDGVTVKWVSGDQIAMWAEKDGVFALDKHAFSLWHYNEEYNDAKFTADIPEMPEGTYNYYAVSPMPAATSGLKASYDIPAVQDGTYNPACDIMVSEPVTGKALTEGDNSQTVNFTFKHKIHILRITIPTNNLGEDISAMEITFPQPIAGRLTIDAANPGADPELTGGSNLLRLNFPTPLKAGAVVYAMIAPIDIPADQTFSILAIGQAGETLPNYVPGKNFAAGHTTPIAYNVPVMGLSYTRILVKIKDLGENTLGEKIDHLKLTAPAGSSFDNGSNERTFDTSNGDKEFYMIYRYFTDNLSGKSITAQYESENALVTNTFTMPQLTAQTTNTNLPILVVPYLMNQDFSGMNSDFENHCDVGITTSNADAGNPDAIQLVSYGLSGWTGARIQGKTAQDAIRISCRFEGGGWGAASAYTQYPGRVDSAPMSGIKAGKNVKVKISFDYCGGQNAWQMNNKGGGTLGNPIFAYGYTTDQNALKGDTDIPSILKSDIAIGTDTAWPAESKYKNEINYITGCANTCRLSWKVNVNRKGGTGGWNVYGANGDHWLYIKNVKVSIAQ